jgi:hypothetical protein
MSSSLTRLVVLVAGAAGLAGLAAHGSPEAPAYELAALERKVFREEPGPELQLEAGAPLASGDLLRTGSRSSADILCPPAMARFRLGAKTRARLASDAPGVLLELEQGRLHALFEKLGLASQQRLVVTPSAVLAVRGTEYGVEVDRKGTTTIVVFSGEVEVADRQGIGEPVRVGRGQYTEVRRGERAQPPIPHEMSPGHWDQGRSPNDGGPMAGADADGRGSSDPFGGLGSGAGGAGVGGSEQRGGGSRGGGGSHGGGH